MQGNFDQTLLTLDPSDFQREFHAYLKPLKALAPEERAGWVAGLGHGVIPQAKEENVRALAEILRKELA